MLRVLDICGLIFIPPLDPDSAAICKEFRPLDSDSAAICMEFRLLDEIEFRLELRHSRRPVCGHQVSGGRKKGKRAICWKEGGKKEGKEGKTKGRK